MSTPTYPPFTVDRFLDVRSDSRHSKAVDAAAVLDWIERSCRFEPVAPARLEYRHAGLLVNLLATHADARGNYPGRTPGPPGMANLFQLRCEDADESRRPEYEAIALRIARHLGWEVVDDREGTLIHPG